MTAQTWRCPRCGTETKCPLPAISVTCAKGHQMRLIEGEPTRPTQPAKGHR